jgi:hypothetical protein
MTETTTAQSLASDVEALRSALAELPADAWRDKALYQCDRLRLAIASSHSEGTRFAAFTLGKMIRDRAGLPDALAGRMQHIRARLEQQGLDLNK